MIQKLYIATALISVSTLISCSASDSNDYVDKSLITPAAENKTAQPAVPGPATNNQAGINTGYPSATAPGTIPVTISPQTNAVNISPQNSSIQSAIATGKLNPAHGEPGHRCDIAVGAPLNSPPAQTTAQPVVNSRPVTQSVPAGMNPPHGEPGHRCDIAVGAPLNSPPAQNTNAGQIKATPVNLNPAKADSSKN